MAIKIYRVALVDDHYIVQITTGRARKLIIPAAMFVDKGSVYLLVCLFVLVVSAVYDDEAFKTDWHRAQLGGNIIASSLNEGHYATVSESGILSVVANEDNGEILWRQQLGIKSGGVFLEAITASETRDSLLIVAFNDVVKQVSVVQVWNQTSSYLVKEIQLHRLEIVALHSVGNKVVLADLSGAVRSIDLNTLETHTGSYIPESYETAEISVLGNGNYIVLADNSKLYLLESSSDTLLSHISLADHNVSVRKLLKLFENKVFYENNAGLIEVLVLNNNNDITDNKVIKTEYESGLFKLLDLNSLILVNNLDYYSSSSIKDRNALQFAYTANEHSVIVFSYNAIQVFDSEFGIEHVKYSHYLDIDFSKLKTLKIDYNEAENHKVDVVLELTTGEILSIHNEVQLWQRDESLAEISHYVIYDPSKGLHSQLHDSETLKHYVIEEEGNLWNAFVNRWINHLQQLQKLDSFIRSASLSDYFNVIIGKDGDNAAKKAEFGLNKQLIVLTKNYKVFNIETENGQVNWKFDQLWKFLPKDTKDFAITSFLNNNNKFIEIWFTNGDLLVLKPSTGIVESFQKRKISPNKKVIPVSLNDLSAFSTNGSSSTLLLNDDLIVVEDTKLQYIDTNAAVKDTVVLEDEFFLIASSPEKLTSYKFNHSKNIIPTWKFKVSEGEKIIANSFNSINRNSKSPIGLILGDKSVLYKYLYPNFIAFAIYNEKEANLVINIADAISGKIIKSITHLASEQIDLVNSRFQLLINDNFLIYSFYSYYPTVSTKINVVEFFESRNSDEKSLSANKSVISVLNSTQELSAPFLKSKSYNFPFKIDDLVISKTKYDITIKNLILKLANGQILLVPKFIINSRRIEGRELTKEEKSEFMMIPYDANIPINNNGVITHKRVVITGNNRDSQYEHFFSVATELESTSLVCYLNNDLFCTKIYPSLQFDVLSSSFNKVKLLITIVGLVVLHLVTKTWVLNKKLNSFWVDNY